MLAAFLLVHDLASLGDVSLVVRADQPVHCKYSFLGPIKINF